MAGQRREWFAKIPTKSLPSVLGMAAGDKLALDSCRDLLDGRGLGETKGVERESREEGEKKKATKISTITCRCPGGKEGPHRRTEYVISFHMSGSHSEFSHLRVTRSNKRILGYLGSSG